MSSVFRTVAGLRVGIQIPHGVLFFARLAWWPLAFLTLAAVALQFGLWQNKMEITGPFAPETNPPQQSLVLTAPSQGDGPWWRRPLIGDSNAAPAESNLRLWIQGQEMGPAHSLHSLIRQETTAGYSHWGSAVIFSLPPGVQNASETVVTLSYPVRPRPSVVLILLTSTLTLIPLLFRERVRLFREQVRSLNLRLPSTVRSAERCKLFLDSALHFLVLGLGLVGLIGSVIFLGSSLYAWMAGWALPTTAPIRWFPWIRWAAHNEPYLGYLLLTLAGLGALKTWLPTSESVKKQSAANELRLRVFLSWITFPIAACAFVLGISAMSDGMLRPGDPQWGNIGGLIPFSDANDHLAQGFFEAKQGIWPSWALRRPLAAAFRTSLLFLSGYSFPAMLVLQACMLAAAASIASHAVMIWRGIWAAMALLGFVYIYARGFVPTSLTEPLGLFWSLLSIPFFVEAFRSGSVRPALVGFAMTSFALMARMGSLFTIPALLLWLVWQFGQSAAEKARVGVVAIGILLGVVGLNSVVSNIYGAGEAVTGSNFSYVLCGLTIGTTWNGCPARLASQGEPLKGDEAAIARRLYALAWQNFDLNPWTFLSRIAAGARNFLTQHPNVIWKGYGAAIDEPAWFFQNALTAFCLFGLWYVVRRRMTELEITFWALVGASVLASSAIIYYDDGARTLAASHPLIVMFLAMGLSDRELSAGNVEIDQRLCSRGTLGLILATVLSVTTPWIAHRLPVISEEHGQGVQGHALVLGGRYMSGLLVVADGSPLRTDIPTVHFSDFEALVTQSGVESYQGLVHPAAPETPFGFVFAPRMEDGVHDPNLFIVPAYVMERYDVAFWKFELQSWQPKSEAQYWLLVTKAEPWHL